MAFDIGKFAESLGGAETFIEAGRREAERRQEIQDYATKLKIRNMLEQQTGGIDPQTLLGIIGGAVKPSRAFTPQQIKETVPVGLTGRPGGGRVLMPRGSTFGGGFIRSPQGEAIGEFSPGYEPKPATETFPSLLGKRFGVGKQEAGRKFLGLSPLKKPAWEKSGVTPHRRNLILGTIKSGFFKDPAGQTQELTSRPEAENFILRQGYVGFKDDTELMKLINRLPEQDKGAVAGDTPEGYQESLENAFNAIETGRNPQAVYNKMISAFPAKAIELRKLLSSEEALPGGKGTGLADYLWSD